MNHQRKYTTLRAVRIALRIILIVLVLFAIYAFSTAKARKDYDSVFPLANAHVSWQQSFCGMPEVRP